MLRQREAYLLIIAAVFVSANQLALILGTDRPISGLWSTAIWLLCAWLGWRLLCNFLPAHDPFIYPATMLLTGWGINLLDRLLPAYTVRQIAWMSLSLIVLLVICALPGHLRWLRRYRYTWLTAGLLLLAATILFGTNPAGVGPQLWLGTGDYFFQPSETLKVLLVAFLASYLADHQTLFRLHPRSWRYLGPIFLMWGLCMVLLVWQRDLGTAAIFFMVFLLMLYVASGQWQLLAGGGALLLIGGWLGYRLFPVVALRVNIWRDPWSDADGSAFQIVQSLMAVAAGGVFGTGIGQGLPNFIPVVHTDFAFAALTEEWGLLGALGVMMTLLLIILRGLRIAALIQHKPFHAYLALGLCLMLSIQSLLIIGGTLNLIPLTGVTLPFVSYGGSSLLTSYMMIGLLLVLSQEVTLHES